MWAVQFLHPRSVPCSPFIKGFQFLACTLLPCVDLLVMLRCLYGVYRAHSTQTKTGKTESSGLSVIVEKRLGSAKVTTITLVQCNTAVDCNVYLRLTLQPDIRANNHQPPPPPAQSETVGIVFWPLSQPEMVVL